MDNTAAKEHIREQVKLMLQLQEIDKFLKELYAKRETLPREIEEYESEKKEMVELLEADRKNYQSVKEQYEEIQKKIDDYLLQLAEAEERLMQVKTQVEFEKVQKEIGIIRSEITNLEETRPQFEHELEIYGERVEMREKELEEKLPRIESEIAYRKKELERIDKIIEVFESWRKEFFDKIDMKYKGKYSALIKRGIYDAIVPVENNTCTGCSITLPPQLVSNVNKENELYRCINCVRFLYVPSPETDEVVKKIREEIDKKFAELMGEETQNQSESSAGKEETAEPDIGEAVGEENSSNDLQEPTPKGEQV